MHLPQIYAVDSHMKIYICALKIKRYRVKYITTVSKYIR